MGFDQPQLGMLYAAVTAIMNTGLEDSHIRDQLVMLRKKVLAGIPGFAEFLRSKGEL